MQTAYENRLARFEKVLADLTKSITEVRHSSDISRDISRKIDDSKEIASLRTSIDGLHKIVNSAVDSILSEVRGQQRNLSTSIQDSFQSQSKEALQVISEHLRKEIGSHFQSDRALNVVIEKIQNTVEQAIEKMGAYQRRKLEEGNEIAISKVKQIAGVEVQKVQNKVEEANRLLPPPK